MSTPPVNRNQLVASLEDQAFGAGAPSLPAALAHAAQRAGWTKPDDQGVRIVVNLPVTGNGTDGYPLGFLARTYMIHNVTTMWWYLPDEILWIPPWLINARIPLVAGTESLRVRLMAPAGVTQGTATSGQLLTIVADSRVLYPAPGVLSQ